MNPKHTNRICLLLKELPQILAYDPTEFPSMHEHQLVLKFYHTALQFCLPEMSKVTTQDEHH